MAKQTFTTGQVLTAAQVNALQTNDFNQTVSAKTASYVLVAADKGTRIEFNTSGSVTCTVNTGLFDAGDTVYIQNTGAGVVTITAGTATVNTSATLAVNQYEGGVLYFVSASSAIWFEYASTATGDITGITTGATSGLTGGVTSGTADLKFNTTAKGALLVGTGSGTVTELTVGSNNTVLTADSTTASGLKWSTPSAGGLTLLATATPSAAASFSFTSISGSYKNLLMYWQDFSASAGGVFATMKLNNDSSSLYEFQTLRIKSQTTNIAVDAADGSSQTSMMGGTSQNNAFGGMFAGSATQTVGRGWLRIWNYTNTTYTFYDWHSKSYDNTVPHQIQTFGWGGYDNSAAITRIDVTTNSGTFSGTCYLYGEA